MQIRQNGGIE